MASASHRLDHDAERLANREQVAAHSQKQLLAIHGVGPKAIRILDEALTANGLDYKGS